MARKAQNLVADKFAISLTIEFGIFYRNLWKS